MKNYKKILTMVLTAAMAVSLLAGCGGGAASSSAAPAADSTSTEASSTAAEPAADAGGEDEGGPQQFEGESPRQQPGGTAGQGPGHDDHSPSQGNHQGLLRPLNGCKISGAHNIKSQHQER